MPDAAAQLQPRAYDRAPPVTPWRVRLAQAADEIAEMIVSNDDPECQFRTATEAAEDIVHIVKLQLREKYGKVFDPIFDGKPY